MKPCELMEVISCCFGLEIANKFDLDREGLIVLLEDGTKVRIKIQYRFKKRGRNDK